MGNRRDYSQLFEWLAIDSTSSFERAYLERLEADLSALGLTVTRQPVAEDRWNLFAWRQPTAGGASGPELLLSTHVDTVPPFFGPTVFEDHVHARGACDTKGGFFAMVEAWRALPASAQTRVGFLLVVGEEVDHIGAIYAAREDYPGLRGIILCEPTRNKVAKGQKGILKLRLTGEGKAGHSAFAEAGESAIHKLVPVLSELISHAWPDDAVLGETTVNVGVVAGGVAANVFAPSASAEILFRAVSSAASLEQRVRELVDVRAEVEVLSANDPMVLTSWERFELDVIPFNTDAPYLGGHAPVVLVGPGDIRLAHGPNERIDFADIEDGIVLYGELIQGLLDGSLALPNPLQPKA